MNIRDFRGAYSGRGVILCSGSTAGEQDLSRITCPILGINESFRSVEYPRTFAHLISDSRGAGAYGQEIADRWPYMPLFVKHRMITPTDTGAPTPRFGPCTIILPTGVGVGPFSFDLERGIYSMGGSVMAIQIMVYLGFEEVVFVGLDLKKRGDVLHFWEGPTDRQAEVALGVQLRELRKIAAVLRRELPAVRVLNVSHDTAADCFEHVPFDWAFGREAA